MHNKAKLALAVITSPGAAFEEILRRKLLGTGLVFVLVAGVLSSAAVVTRAMVLGPLDYFGLGHYNPLAWFGLFLLYALALQKLLKWLGTEIEFLDLLIVMGWAQITLVIVELMSAVGGAIALWGQSAGMAPQFIQSLSAVLELAYVAIIGVGVHVATRTPMARGVMSYVVVSIAATLAFTVTYDSSRVKLFAGALQGIAGAAQQVAASDMIAWLAASVVGLGLGAWHLARALSWDAAKRNAAVAVCIVLGLATLVSYVYVFSTVDYYGRLLAAQRDYDADKFDRAALKTRSLIPMSTLSASRLILDTADLYFLARKPRLSIRYYQKFMGMVREARMGKEEARQTARPLAGIGAVYDQEGKYVLALKQFKAAAKALPEFRDPWVRLAVTYDRLGEYPNAIESGEHAVRKLGSKAVVVQVALAQAYTATGDAKKARATVKAVRETDDDLAKRIEKGPGGWTRAVAALGPSDLKFPLEKEPVVPPQRPRKSKARR